MAKKSSIKKSKVSKPNAKSGSKKKRVSLNPLREQLSILTARANKLVDQLIESNKPSRALFEAQRTFRRLRSRKGQSTLFTAELKDRRQINREFARVQAFLGDYTSTVSGADYFTSDLSDLVGSFSNYNRGLPHNLDEELLKEVFDTYRRVVEAAGGWERAVGLFKGKESLIGFGSEVLINNIYDMIENGYEASDIISIALDMINEAHRDYELMASKAVGNYDYGVIFDDEETTARRKYFERKFMMKKEGYGKGTPLWK